MNWRTYARRNDLIYNAQTGKVKRIEPEKGYNWITKEWPAIINTSIHDIVRANVLKYKREAKS